MNSNDKSIFLCQDSHNIARVYGAEVLKRLSTDGQIYKKADILADPARFADVTCLFSTWGMPTFTEEEIETCFPTLTAVFYAAGSVQSFAAPFLRRGVRVFSAWQANAVPVAEFTLAQILLATKGFFPAAAAQSVGDVLRARAAVGGYPGNYGVAVGIIGVGMIGRRVMELLRPFRLRVKAFDAFLSSEEIAAFGGEKVSLEELFSDCLVVSNHLASNAATRGMLGYEHFSRLPRNATFINTGRGAQVREAELVCLLTERPDVTALLDVTDPEPPRPDHPFYTLPNCILTPHIAGSMGDEVRRMGAYMEEAYRDFSAAVASPCEVSLAMLATMA